VAITLSRKGHQAALSQSHIEIAVAIPGNRYYGRGIRNIL